MAPEFNKNTKLITPWPTHGQVPSARSQKDVMLAANRKHIMGPKRGPQAFVLGIRFWQFLDICSNSFSEVKDFHNFRSVFSKYFAYVCLTCLEPLDPCFLTKVWFLARLRCYKVSIVNIVLFFKFDLLLIGFGLHWGSFWCPFWQHFETRGSLKYHWESMWNFTLKKLTQKS